MTYSRRKFLGTALSAGASRLIAHASAQSAAAGPDLFYLESDSLIISIDRKSGCVNRIESKDGAWKLQGAGMRIHVPAPEHRFHYVTERHAGAPRIESDGRQAAIMWMGFESERMGKLDIEIRQSIRLVGAGAGFSYGIRKGSPAGVTCEVVLDGRNKAGLHWVSPEEPEPQVRTGKLQMMPGSAAVVLEG